MKNYSFGLLALFVALSVSSCKDDAIESITNDDPFADQPGVASCTVQEFEDDTEGFDPYNPSGSAESRSSLTYNEQKGMVFSWATVFPWDKITVYSATDAAENKTTYSLNEVSDHTAAFKSEQLNLRNNTRYYAITKSNDPGFAPAGYDASSRDDVKLSYAGQKQIGDFNSDHLGAYDYMAASGVSNNNNHVSFEFKHLGATLMIIPSFPEWIDEDDHSKGKYDWTGTKWTRLEMYSDDNDFCQPSRSINLREGLNGDGTYTPALNTLDMSLAENYNGPRFSIDLRAKSDSEDGISPVNNQLQIFMEVPPIIFSGTHRFVFRLEGKDASGKEISRFGVFERNRPIYAGKAIKMAMKTYPTSDFYLRIKVHLNWHESSVWEPTRAGTSIGDPGDGETFTLPKYIYGWICVEKPEGKILKHREKIVLPIEGDKTIATYWKQADDSYTFTLEFPFKFSLDGTFTYCNVFAIASAEELNYAMDEDIVNNTVSQTDILEKTINIKYLNPENSSDTVFSTYENMIKNIWTTPYNPNEDQFVGHVCTGMNINLYHLASKVDLQWNGTTPAEYVQINRVQTQGIKVFKPTDNEAYSVVPDPLTKINGRYVPDEDEKYYGRHVFYVAQPKDAIYWMKTKRDGNVEINTKVDFDDNDIYTSWFKADVQLP